MPYYRPNNILQFKALYNDHFELLCSFAHRYINDVEQTEDIVQDVFISFWNKKRSFDTLNGLKAYLYTMVKNRCLNYIKHQTVEQRKTQQLILELESDLVTGQHVIEEEVAVNLIYEIRQLPAACQEITFLALNGMKNNEIAIELNVSVNTVKTQKKIAYQKLRTSLNGRLNTLLYFLL